MEDAVLTMRLALLLLALALALALPASAGNVCAKIYDPPVTNWVLDKPGIGHWETSGERFYLISWAWLNLLPFDFRKVYTVRPCTMAEWIRSGVPDAGDYEFFPGEE